MDPLTILARPRRDYEYPSTRVHIKVPRTRIVGKLSTGTFLVVIISLILGLAFYVAMPPFIDDAVAALDATNDSSAITMLRLLPFIVASLFVAFAVLYLIAEFKAVT